MTEVPQPRLRILVTGGAGYIGSHALAHLRRAGHELEVLDHLEQGHRGAIPSGVPLHQVDLRDAPAVERVLAAGRFDTVMHFAALISVAESVAFPDRYLENNLGGTRNLIRALEASDTRRLVFSSTAAVYGVPQKVPIDETFPIAPVNPYGESKALAERALRKWADADSRRSLAILRYFNVAGASLDASLGEDHEPETHLVPNVLRSAIEGSTPMTVYGQDYPTPDGTCVRDYIHVEDLVDAHAHVLERLGAGDRYCFNLGIGRGFSVQEVIQTAEAVTGRSIPVVYGPRREGDVAELRSDPGRIKAQLGWRAKVRELRPMLESAWNWMRAHPRGHREV